MYGGNVDWSFEFFVDVLEIDLNMVDCGVF